MITYEDLLEARGKGEAEVIELMERAVQLHQSTVLYRTALDATAYDRHENPTITKYQKFLYTVSGRKVPDLLSANWKTKNGMFPYFVTQQAAHLLGNGVTLKPENKDKLGESFDAVILEAAHDALVCGEVYIYRGLSCRAFTPLEYVPLLSEESGEIMAGIRWWQVDGGHPLRYTLMELDGYTEYIRRTGEKTQIYRDKRAYIYTGTKSDANGLELEGADNYPGFPVVPLYANRYHQSRLVGLREKLDCYDFIESGFANDVDEASILYWAITNAGGMNDTDLIKFVERLRTIHAATIDEDVKVEAKSVEPPYEAREVALKRLENGLYRDAMALDVRQMQAGNVTATQIEAAYEPLTGLCDEFEAQVTTCIKGLLALSGDTDEPGYSRTMIRNQYEETQKVMLAAGHLPDEILLRKLPWMTPDDVEEALAAQDSADFARFNAGTGFRTSGGENGSQGELDGLGGDKE